MVFIWFDVQTSSSSNINIFHFMAHIIWVISYELYYMTIDMTHMIWVWWENPSQDDDGDCFLNRIEVINISRFNGTPITRNKTSKTTTTILVTGIFAASNVSKSSKSESGIKVPEATGPGPNGPGPDNFEKSKTDSD